ncbi:MAG: ECF-type sigma factor [Planctomycetota bacterium]
MKPEPDIHITTLLEKIQQGNKEAENQLVERVYGELRRLAGHMMIRERPNHTLQPTALVNEALIRLADDRVLSHLPNKRYFFSAAVLAMRRVLVDHARQRSAQKRQGSRRRIPLDDYPEALAQGDVDVERLDAALSELEKLNERQYRVVMLRFFGGLSMPEIAEQLDISLSTIESDWRIARAWLRIRMEEEDESSRMATS